MVCRCDRSGGYAVPPLHQPPQGSLQKTARQWDRRTRELGHVGATARVPQAGEESVAKSPIWMGTERIAAGQN